MCKIVGREGTASLVVWYLHWFRRYRKKTRGGARNSPPPPPVGRGLKFLITPMKIEEPREWNTYMTNGKFEVFKGFQQGRRHEVLLGGGGSGYRSQDQPTPKFLFLMEFRTLNLENVENFTFSFVWIKNVLKYRNFWRDVNHWFLDCGDAFSRFRRSWCSKNCSKVL